jgi:hypothetical protein
LIRLKILQPLPVASIDGIRLDCYEIGQEYEVGNSIGALLLAEGWAEPVPLDAPPMPALFPFDDPFADHKLYRKRLPDLVRKLHREVPLEPVVKRSTHGRALAAELQRKRRTPPPR